MLLYKPPFLAVDALTVFPDHADPEAFHYLVAVPDLVTEGGEPAFWATAVLPPVAAGSGSASGNTPADPGLTRASLSFDVRLAATDAALADLPREIQRHYGRQARRLTPAPLASGKARLAVARPGGETPGKDLFVYEGQPPSLIDDNRAAFAVAAQGDEAQSLVASLSVGHVPAVVSYELAFLGLAPSFEASMKVHWKEVYRQFRRRDSTNFIFSSEEVDNAVTALEEQRAIEIEVRELDPEGAKAATKALFDELKSEVIKKLFETPRQAGDLPIEDRIGRGVREVLTSIVPGVAHSLRQVDETDLQEATIDLREQQVKAYPFYPQSTLAGILTRAGGAASRLQLVDVDRLPGRVEEVVVEMAGGAGRLGVKTVILEVQALAAGRDEPLLDQSVELDAATPGRQVLRYRRPGSEEPALRYRARMALDPALAPAGRETWELDWRPASGQRVWFNPEEWLDVVTLRLEVDDPALFDLPATVDMDVEAWLPGEAAPFRRSHFDFGKGALAQELSIVMPEGQVPVLRGRETFRRRGEPDFVHELADLAGPVHRIMNPFGLAWSMEVRAVADWTQTEALFAELRVRDAARQVWLQDEHRFTTADTVYTLRFSTSRETPRKAEARITRVRKDGGIVRGPWADLAGPVVAVTDGVKAERRVRATLSAPGFVPAEVRKAWVETTYQDPAHGVDASGRLDLNGDRAVADWVHPFPDPSRPTYRYRLRALGAGGERYNAPWAESAADDLDLALPVDPWDV